MPKFVIERQVPGVGSMSPEQLRAVSETSCSVLRNLGPQIQWLHSYKLRAAGIAIHRVQPVKQSLEDLYMEAVIDPTTAETPAG